MTFTCTAIAVRRHDRTGPSDAVTGADAGLAGQVTVELERSKKPVFVAETLSGLVPR